MQRLGMDEQFGVKWNYCGWKNRRFKQKIAKKCKKSCQFSQNVCKLALQVSELMEKIECQHGSNHKLVEEWHEFFSASIYPIPLGLFVDLGPEAANGAVQESFLCALGK